MFHQASHVDRFESVLCCVLTVMSLCCIRGQEQHNSKLRAEIAGIKRVVDG